MLDGWRIVAFVARSQSAALDAMSEPSESPPKNLLSSLILIFVALIGVAGVALGVLWFFNNYIAKHQPRFVLHGHQHVQQETRVEVTRVIGTYGFRWLVIPE